jgi:hypothetical protein
VAFGGSEHLRSQESRRSAIWCSYFHSNAWSGGQDVYSRLGWPINNTNQDLTQTPIFVSPSDDDLRRDYRQSAVQTSVDTLAIAVDWHWTGKLCPYMYLPFKVASFAPVSLYFSFCDSRYISSFIKNKDPFVKLVLETSTMNGIGVLQISLLSSLRTSGSGIELVQRLFSTMVCH